MTEKAFGGDTTQRVDTYPDGSHALVVKAVDGGASMSYARAYSADGRTLTESATPDSGSPVYSRTLTLRTAYEPMSWVTQTKWTSSNGSSDIPSNLLMLGGSPLTLGSSYITLTPA